MRQVGILRSVYAVLRHRPPRARKPRTTHAGARWTISWRRVAGGTGKDYLEISTEGKLLPVTSRASGHGAVTPGRAPARPRRRG
jgi:hypothetical protein